MYHFTLGNARSTPALVTASGVSGTSKAFADYVNKAQRRLLRRGDWFDTDQQVKLCISGCIIAWPRWVGAIRGVRFAGCFQRPAGIFNNWYSFTKPDAQGWNNWNSNAVLEDINEAPTFNDINGTTGKQLRYYVVHHSDVGKTITIFGSQYGAQPLQELDNGVWENGMTLTAAAPYATSATLVTRIDAVTRDATDGLAYLYEYDPATGKMRDLAIYQPGDTNPRFRRSRIVNKPLNQTPPDANGICWSNIEALIKVEFVEAVADRDFLMLDNFDALEFMIQAIKAEESNDEQTALVKITKAIQELNFDLRNKNLDNQTTVFVDATMGRGIKSAY